MRVMVANAAEGLGREIVPRLIAAGHEVVGTTSVPGRLTVPGVTEVVAPLHDRAAFLDAVSGVRFDAVVHAPDASTPLTYREARRSFRARVEGTNTLVAAARREGAIRFVGASVYAGYGYRDHGDDPLTETAPFGQETDGRIQLVQQSLASLEQQVRAFGGVTLRYGILYRPDDRPAPYSADWDGALPWLHIEDAADATVAALDNGAPRAVYNIADDDPASWRAMQQALALRAGDAYPRPVSSWVMSTVTPFAAHLVARTSMRLATSRAKRDLRWRPRFASHRDAL